MKYLVKSILMGIALDYPGVTLDNLREEHYFYVAHEYVICKVQGKLDESMHKIIWDMSLPFNKKSYEAAKEKLAKTPIPYGTT